MTALQINAQDAVDACEKAFKEKRLLFFDPDFMKFNSSDRACRNHRNGYVCAIGASIPEDDNASNSVGGLLVAGEISTDNADVLYKLQGAHDNSARLPSTEAAKKDFKKRLTEIKKEYNLN